MTKITNTFFSLPLEKRTRESLDKIVKSNTLIEKVIEIKPISEKVRQEIIKTAIEDFIIELYESRGEYTRLVDFDELESYLELKFKNDIKTSN